MHTLLAAAVTRLSFSKDVQAGCSTLGKVSRYHLLIYMHSVQHEASSMQRECASFKIEHATFEHRCSRAGTAVALWWCSMRDQGSRHGLLQSGSGLHSSGLQLAAGVHSSAGICVTAHWPARDAVSCTSNAGGISRPRRSCVLRVLGFQHAAAGERKARRGSKPRFPAPRSLFCRPLAGDLAEREVEPDADVFDGTKIQVRLSTWLAPAPAAALPPRSCWFATSHAHS